MPGTYQYDVEIKSNVAKLLSDMKQVQDRLDTVEGKEYKIKLNVDEKKLSSVISNLEKMLDSLGKGTGDFKQFENLSKELSSIVSEVQSLSKAFGKVDDSGAKTLLSSIQNIDKSLSELSQNILNVNKNMSNMGGNTSGAVKQVENITNESKKAASALEDVAKAQGKVNGQKTNISSDISSQVKISDNITDQIVSNEKKKQEAYKATAETVMYHAGTLSKLNKAETNGRFYGSNRGTGYFGTGHYFVDSNSKHYLDESSTYSKLPYSSIDISQYDNLFKANNDTIAKSLHEFLKNLTRYTQGDTKFNTNELFSQFENVFGNTVMDIKEFESRINGLKDFMSKSNLSDRSDSVSTQFMKSLGYGGVDTRGTKFADTEYGTVIYDLKEESVLQANITDELQKQGQMLEKINYEKGQVFDSSEDSRLQDIINQQEKGKAIREEYNKIYDDTKLDSYSTELSEINKKLDENDEIIGNCRLGIENAEKEAQQFAKEMKELGIEMSNEEVQNSAIESKKSYQERIDELEKERPLLEARRQELEANLDVESKLSKAAMERATATVEDRMKDAFPDKDVSASIESATNSIKEENNVLEQNTQKVKENTQAKEQNANVNLNKYNKRLDSYNDKIDKYKSTIDRFNDGGWTSDAYLKNVQAVKDAVAQYKTLLDNINTNQDGIASDEDIQNLDKYEKKIKDTIATVTNMSASEKGYNFVSGQKELDKIHKLLNENSKMSSEAKAKIKAYYAEIESGNPSMSLDKIHGEIMKIYNAEVEAGRAGKSLWDIFKTSGLHQIVAQAAGMFGFYDLINVGKQFASIVIDINSQITELAKVSEQTSKQIYGDFDSYADIAKEVRGTISDTISATADWSKNGYGIPDAKQLAEISQLYKNVGDGIDINQANESLISTLKGFQLEADQAEHIVDVFNEVSNNEAISSAGIGEALQRSAASFNAASTSLEKSVALVSATNSVLQDPEKVGNMWRTVSARLRGSETELKEMGEDTDGLVTSTSKLQALVKGITGFDIMKDKDTYKDIYDIVLGIGEKWKDLSDIDRASLLEALAGKQQSNALAAALSNIDILKKSYEEATNAEGSARKENEEYSKSIQASIDLAQAKLEQLANDTLNSDFLKGAIDAGGKLIDILDGIVKSGNAISIVFTTISGYLGSKNLGWQTKMTLWCDAQYIPRAEVRILG